MNDQRMVMRMWQRFVVVATVLLASAGAYAQTAIEAVSGSIQGGTEVVRIDLS